MTLSEIQKVHELDQNNNLLINKQIVSLFYFRAGYSEKDYTTEVRISIYIGIMARKRNH